MSRNENRRKRTTTTRLVNPGTGPVVYDEEGRVLGAGERVEVDALDDAGRAAVERGYLVTEDADTDDAADAPTETATVPESSESGASDRE